MASSINRSYAVLLLQLIAFVPVWEWYVRRIVDGSDEPWGLAALAACVANFLIDKPDARSEPPSLFIPALVTLAYAASSPIMPRLFQAAIALTAIGCTLSSLKFRARFHVPMWGLLLLSLPVVASLQFYFGYPMRVVSGAIAAPMLQLAGFSVALEGTCLRYGADLITIDAPCSGVRMLWAGLFLAFNAAWVYRLSPPKTFLAAAISVAIVICANGLRAATLFFVEMSPDSASPWRHDGVGLVLFGVTAILVIRLGQRLGGTAKCAT